MKMERKISKSNFGKSQCQSWLFYYTKNNLKGVFQRQNDKQYESNGEGCNALYP